MIKIILILLAMSSAQVMAHSVVPKQNNSSDTSHEHEMEEVREMMRTARQSSDPESYKRARDHLDKIEHTVEAELYEAEIQQYFHQFNDAIETLKSIPESANRDVLLANIYYTQGEFMKQREVCKNLFGKIEQLIALTCLSQAGSVNGQLESSYDLLEKAVEQAGNGNKEAIHWALVTLAEMAERLGRLNMAATHYAAALNVNSHDVASRIAYADVLLQQNRASEALEVTGSYVQHDLVFMRYVRALRMADDKLQAKAYADLKERVNNYSKDKEHTHYDFIAEYHLFFTLNNEAALIWAKKHWETQKTPRDTRLLAVIAAKSGDSAALDAIYKWRDRYKLEDHMLDAIL